MRSYLRVLIVGVAAFGMVAAPLAALAQAVRLAPVDEYFGRYNESVLEIRNRLDRLEAKADAENASPDEIGGIDYVDEAVVDWQRRYPSDPWALDAMSRLIDCYARAGAGQSPRATALLAVLTHGYPTSPKTGDAILALADASMPDVDSAALVSGEVVDASTGTPIPGAVVIVAPNHESMDIASTPFATTGNDGSFQVKDVPLGQAYTVGAVSLAHAEYIVVEPPRGSSYREYHGMIDGSAGNAQAGIIRLTTR